MSQLSVNHLLGIKYLTAQDIELIFNTADQFKEVILTKKRHYSIGVEIGYIRTKFTRNATRRSRGFRL